MSIVKDRDTGRSKGFAFIEFERAGDAEDAIRGADGHVSKQIFVRESF